MENIKVGVALIAKKDGKILLGKRTSKHGEGTWGFIGGHLEFGETFEECIKREAQEEAGVDLDNIEFYTLTEDFFSQDKHYITIFMKGEIIGEEKVMEKDKIPEWKWFDENKLPENLFLPIINLLNNGYKI